MHFSCNYDMLSAVKRLLSSASFGGAGCKGKLNTGKERILMKALFIGGTGTISMAIVRRLAENPLWGFIRRGG